MTGGLAAIPDIRHTPSGSFVCVGRSPGLRILGLWAQRRRGLPDKCQWRLRGLSGHGRGGGCVWFGAGKNPKPRHSLFTQTIPGTNTYVLRRAMVSVKGIARRVI